MEYEQSISDTYLTWNNVDLPSSRRLVVSMWRHCLRIRIDQKTSLIILPEVSTSCRPISSYWGDNTIISSRGKAQLIKDVKLAVKAAKFPIRARCKVKDAAFYETLFKQSNIDIKLNGVDVNLGSRIPNCEQYFVLYCSTPLAEAFLTQTKFSF